MHGCHNVKSLAFGVTGTPTAADSIDGQREKRKADIAPLLLRLLYFPEYYIVVVKSPYLTPVRTYC